LNESKDGDEILSTVTKIYATIRQFVVNYPDLVAVTLIFETLVVIVSTVIAVL